MRISDWSSDVCSSDLVLGEFLGIEPPALGIGGEAAEAAEGRQAGQFGLHRALEMMPRYAFVIGERLELGLRHVAKVVEVHIIGARPRPVGRGRLIDRKRTRLNYSQQCATRMPSSASKQQT